MNQIRRPAMPDSICSREDRQRDAIEYDDGNPGTIAPRDDRRDANGTIRRDGIAVTRCFRAPLAEIECGTMVEYDDGNPATIAAGA